MKDEEYFRKAYPDSCYGDKPLSPYWDFFQDGVEFGERQSEKEIKELKKVNRLLGERCKQLLKDKGDLTDTIEKMRNCGNCNGIIEGGIRTAKCKVCIDSKDLPLWGMKEND